MWRKIGRSGLLLVLAGYGLARGQLSSSAYRVLGQIDFRHNAVNMVQGLELNAPWSMALDAREGRVRLYIADTRNARVLAWPDARSYQMGDPPALVLGQSDFRLTGTRGIGAKGLNQPAGLAVDPANGNLYVADFGNSRVLRFPAPFANPSRVEPDAVYGQPGFTSFDPNTGGITSHSLNRPRAVAFDAAGNLWVADSGNHRLLRFSAAVLDATTPADADLVVGQKDFTSGSPNGGAGVNASGLDTPAGVAFDLQNHLYVSDGNNNRVLRFAAPLGPNPAATTVFGQTGFTTRLVPPQATEFTLAGPAGLCVDAGGSLYVAIPSDNRVLTFGAGTASGSPAVRVLGQADLRSTRPNANVFPQASPNTLAGPLDVKLDGEGNIFVADSGNHRVLAFPRDSRSANRVWGQNDFRTNGVNQIKPGSLNAAYAIAVDYSQAPFPLYVSDITNHRVLIWKDATRFRDGDPADLVIGQPDLRTAHGNVDTGGQNPSATSLSSPAGIALDPAGNLYVADSGNHRVLRYPRPVSQPGRITADAVFGQTDFSSASSAAVTASSLRRPAGVAVAPDGSVFVSDNGNHRVLEFSAGGSSGAAAIRVYGQPNFTSSTLPSSVSAQTLSSPQGVFVDAGYNLYVVDAGANRVLIFPNTQAAPLGGMAAAFVIGQDRFDATGGTLLRGPVGVALDSSGQIYVADAGHHRVLAFSSLLFLPVAGGVPAAVIGQRDLSGAQRNWNSPDGLATPEGLSDPAGVYVDRVDTLYIGDGGNNRVVHFLKAVAAVNAAHFQASVPVARGGLVTLFGAGLGEQTEQASETPWRSALANREVVINDEIRAPLMAVSPTQATLQIPSGVPLGANRLAVRVATSGEAIAGGNVLVAAVSPGLFTVSQDGRGQAAAVNQDGRVNSSATPAVRGGVVTLYGTGQGQVSPPVADGEAAPSGMLAQTVAVPTSDGRACLTSQPSVCVAIGNAFGDIQYSGLAPGYVGLWQINVRIPESVPAGNAVAVRVVINGTPSNVVTVAIR